MPTSTLRVITERMLDLLSDDDRRVIELHLAVARLSPERRSRLLDRFDGSFEAFADDMQAFIQAATSVSPGSHEDVLLAASHVAAYVETDEARFGADGKPSDSDELWDRNGVPYALDERGNPIHDAATDYLAPPRTADGQVPAVTPAWSVEMSAGPAAVSNLPSRNESADSATNQRRFVNDPFVSTPWGMLRSSETAAGLETDAEGHLVHRRGELAALKAVHAVLDDRQQVTAVPTCPVCGLDEASPECYCPCESATIENIRAALHGIEMSTGPAIVGELPSRNEFAAMVLTAMPETWHFGELTALGARGPDGVQYGGEFDVVLVTAFIDGGDEARLEVTWDRETQRLCLVEVDHGGETMGETTSFAQVRAADLPTRLSELLAAHSADFDANDDDDRGDDYGASEASSL